MDRGTWRATVHGQGHEESDMTERLRVHTQPITCHFWAEPRTQYEERRSRVICLRPPNRFSVAVRGLQLKSVPSFPGTGRLRLPSE